MVDNGDITAVVVNDESEATLKRLYYYNEELNEVHVLGKAVAFQSDVM